MTVIKWGPSTYGTDETSLRTITPARDDIYVFSRFRAATREQRYNRMARPLAMEFESRVKTLSEALSSFRWPSEDTPFANARLVTRDPMLEGHADAEVVPWRDAERYYRSFSSGVGEDDPLSLVAPGDYSFSVSQGGSSASISLTVEDDWTDGDVVQAVADGINQSSLPVQAHVIRQNSPNLRVDGQVATGMSLGLSVNAAYDDQDVSLRDTSGHLLAALNLRETDSPVGPAQQRRYNMQNLERFEPTAYYSDTFDPNAETAISAGSYDYTWSLGSSSGEFTLDVESGDTWEDVLNRFGNALTSSGYSAARFDVQDVRRPSDLVQDDYLLMDGVALAVTARNPKLGERLYLDASGESDAEIETARQALETMGLHETAQPGSDGRMIVNGWEQTRAPGVFSQDEGRVLITQEAPFGETLPLKVVEAMETLENGVQDIVDGYNSVRRIVIRNEDLFRSGLAGQWRNPVESRDIALGNLGVQEFGEDRLLWAEADEFFAALGRDATGVKQTLLGANGQGGLFGRWSELADEVLEQGGEAYLVNPAEVETSSLRPPTPRTEVQLDKGYRLLDVVEEGTASLEDVLPDPLSGSIVDETG